MNKKNVRKRIGMTSSFVDETCCHHQQNGYGKDDQNTDFGLETSDNNNCIKNMNYVQCEGNYLIAQVNDPPPPLTVTDEKAEKRRNKKEKQKERRLKRKLEARRRESMIFLPTSSQLLLASCDGEEQILQLENCLSLKKMKVTLFKCPLTTLEYFLKEIPCVILDAKKRFFSSILSSILSESSRAGRIVPVCVEYSIISLFCGVVVIIAYFWIVSNGPLSVRLKQSISWHSYWIFLGILSSIGLGTGLHTFLIYLSPFIAKVTLAAEECSSVDFPQPPYPDQILCPDPGQSDTGYVLEQGESVSIFDIMGKVRWECLSWGLGTALGELPPYFMARAAKLSKMDRHTTAVNDINLLEIWKKTSKKEKRKQEKIMQENWDNGRDGGLIETFKQGMQSLVKKVGFWGILIGASIPNPLFDLAGITCGHFLVPFTTFFGATVIGKSIIKAQLQMTSVVLAFNEKSLKRVETFVEAIPKIGPSLKDSFVEFVDFQRAALRNPESSSDSGGIVQFFLDKLVLLMVLYFVVSIVNGMAQNYQKRPVARTKDKNHRGEKKSRKRKRKNKKLKSKSTLL